MAVPKKKTSRARRGNRRSHDAIKPINVVVDSVTGEYKLPHHMSIVDGTYKGRQVIVEAEDDSDEQEGGK